MRASPTFAIRRQFQLFLRVAGRTFGLMEITRPAPDAPIDPQTFYWRINRTQYRFALTALMVMVSLPSKRSPNVEITG